MVAAKSYFVCIIILAAGLSTRFGRNKLLEPIGGKTMIERVVSESLKSQAKQVVVVCGHEFEKIRGKLKDLECEVVLNEDFEKGQSFSIKKGLTRVNPVADAIMVLPGDIALVNHSIIDAVISGYSMSHATIMAAGHNGHSGHPILFDKSLLVEIRNISEETQGLRSVVSRHESDVRIIETSDASLIDVDKQDDLSRISPNSDFQNKKSA